MPIDRSSHYTSSPAPGAMQALQQSAILRNELESLKHEIDATVARLHKSPGKNMWPYPEVSVLGPCPEYPLAYPRLARSITSGPFSLDAVSCSSAQSQTPHGAPSVNHRAESTFYHSSDSRRPAMSRTKDIRCQSKSKVEQMNYSGTQPPHRKILRVERYIRPVSVVSAGRRSRKAAGSLASGHSSTGFTTKVGLRQAGDSANYCTSHCNSENLKSEMRALSVAGAIIAAGEIDCNDAGQRVRSTEY